MTGNRFQVSGHCLGFPFMSTSEQTLGPATSIFAFRLPQKFPASLIELCQTGLSDEVCFRAQSSIFCRSSSTSGGAAKTMPFLGSLPVPLNTEGSKGV